MRNRRRLLLAAALLLGAVSRAQGQDAAPPRAEPPRAEPLRGVVFDSLARKPLADAMVRIVGTSALAKTDDKGRFRFDSVTTGPVGLQVEHPMLDSIGLYELTARVAHDGRTEARVAVPSFATMTRAVCGRAVAGDSAMVYGTLLTPQSAPAANAPVRFSWLSVRVAGSTIAPRQMHYDTHTDSLGRFAACALPYDEPVEFTAHDARNDGWTLTMPIPAQHARILRQELMLSVTADVRALTEGDVLGVRPTRGPRSVVRGAVQGTDGQPVPNAVVYVGTLAELRADSSGRFFAPDIPVGSHRIEAFAVGRMPRSRVANVRVGDTANVVLTLDRVTALGIVRTQATTASALVLGFEERKRQGFGYARDSLELARMPSLMAAMSTVPSVVARTGRGGIPIVLLPAPKGGQCEARLFVDGRPDTWDRVASMIPKDLAWMEIYPRWVLQPMEFQAPMTACGSVNLVTKWRVNP
ncbi:MAG: carboxypeptidase regulatory-like domain-containing protein [Gemmatimonadaceae bacterium]|nr:carboxypeptidase regulatory-like domain-containing protein [Gemmatimonadaceae bacterium]